MHYSLILLLLILCINICKVLSDCAHCCAFPWNSEQSCSDAYNNSIGYCCGIKSGAISICCGIGYDCNLQDNTCFINNDNNSSLSNSLIIFIVLLSVSVTVLLIVFICK